MTLERLRELKWIVLCFLSIQCFLNLPIYLPDDFLKTLSIILSGLLTLISTHKINLQYGYRADYTSNSLNLVCTGKVNILRLLFKGEKQH